MGTDLPVGDNDVQGLVNPRVEVVAVSPNSPASHAGLKIGDTIDDVKVNNSTTSIGKISDFQAITGDNKGKELTVIAKRNGKELNFNLTPRINTPAGEGSVGVGLERMATLIKKTSWYMAPIQGATYTWQTTVNSLKGLYVVLANLIGGKGAPQGAAFAGPIGITVFLANAASYGLGFFLYFVGIICVFLAIFNLFPIPALDGGKLIFLLIEKIKGKPVSVKVEQSITLTCFVILICLSLFITVKFDFSRMADYFKSSL